MQKVNGGHGTAVAQDWLRKREDGSGGAAIGVAQCLALAVPRALITAVQVPLRGIWAMEVPAMYWGSASVAPR